MAYGALIGLVHAPASRPAACGRRGRRARGAEAGHTCGSKSPWGVDQKGWWLIYGESMHNIWLIYG